MDHQLVELSMELTNSCPLACVHCSSGSSPKVLPNELVYAEHLDVLMQARELGATVLSLSGGTPLNYDPLDQPHGLVSLVRKAMSIGYKEVLIYVTGQSLYGKHIYAYPDIDGLLGFDAVRWILSLHSNDFSTNDRIMRRNGALSEIMLSARWLKEREETIEVHMVPMRPNFRDISGVRSLCADLGVSKMSCLRFVPQTRGKEHEYELGMNKAEFSEMQFIIHQEFVKNGSHPVELRLGCPIDFRHAIGILDEKRKPCHAGNDLILVRPQGNVHPCAAWKSLPVDSNVRKTRLKDIWEHSQVFNGIRSFKVSGYNTVGGVCSSCNMLHSCLTGCPAQRLHAADATDMSSLYLPTSDPLCPRGD